GALSTSFRTHVRSAAGWPSASESTSSRSCDSRDLFSFPVRIYTVATMTKSRALLSSFALLSSVAFGLRPAAPTAPATPEQESVKHGRQLSREGKQDEALALFNKALKEDPNLYEAHLGAGVALDLKGEYIEARKHLGRAIETASTQQKD